MKAIQTDAIITSLSSRQDKSLRLSVVTPELTPQEKAIFMELQGINLDMTFKPMDEANVEEYKIDKDIERLTPSQRLRRAMYVYWKQTVKEGSFDNYYRAEMERLIENIKAKLE